MNDRTIDPASIAFKFGGETTDATTHIGLAISEDDGTVTTVALPIHDAMAVGTSLVACCDSLAGRPVRSW